MLRRPFYFSKKKLDVWILEVGLGGRLDPANYFDADISVITKVALDHENILGKGVENIGRKKLVFLDLIKLLYLEKDLYLTAF